MQWLAWRVRAPSILLLLLAGFLAGPVTGLLDPDALLGDLLHPIIGLSVAIIVFEGGLGLRLRELGAHGRAVLRLVTLGVAITAAIGALAAWKFLGLPWDLALLLGVILTVSGPTVVLPLLRTVRVSRRLDAVLRWEGILVDPVGAVLAVLLFEAFSHGTGTAGLADAARAIVPTMLIGVAVGALAAWTLIGLEARYWIPDHLVAAVALGFVVLAYSVTNAVVEEAGLVAVTMMGVVLANQQRTDIHHLVDFKENLSQVLLGSLFVLLAARIDLADLADLRVGAIAFVASLIFVARPLAVLASTAGTDVGWRQRAFMAWMAPRGIVAMAVSAFFGLRLEQAGRPEGALFVPVTFLVIVTTVVLYGLTARPVAKLLAVAGPRPEGVLFVGANRFARELARILEEERFPVLLADTDREAILAAKTDGRPARLANPLDPHFDDEVDMAGIGRLWAMTPDASHNHLACVRYASSLGRAKVYRVADDGAAATPTGRTLFHARLTYRVLRDRLAGGWTVRRTPMTEKYGLEDHQDRYPDMVPLLLLHEGKMEVFTTDHEPPVTAGKVLVSFVPPEPLHDKPSA